MISSWMIYGIIVLGNIGVILCVFAIIASLVLIFICMWYAIEYSDDSSSEETKKIKPICRSTIICVVVLWVLAALCPSAKEMAAIYLIPKIANNEHVQNISDKSLTVLEKYLDEWIKDQMGKKEK